MKIEKLGAGTKIPSIKNLWENNPAYNIDNPTTTPNQMQTQQKHQVPAQPTEPDPLDTSGADDSGNPANNRNSYLNVFDF